MKNDFTIDDYKLIKEIDKIHFSWFYIVVLFLLIVGIVLILFNYDFHVYEKQTLIKNDNDFLMIVDSKKIQEIESQAYIYINYKKYKYTIKQIDLDYSNVDGGIYQTIHINPYNYNTNSIITECYFLKSKSSIIEMIIKFIEGGIG